MNLERPEVVSAQQEAWEKKVAQVAKRKDKAGGTMDPGIVETVAAFNIHAIPTSQSCEGHSDHGHCVPWVQVEAMNEPEEHYHNEQRIYQEVLTKYGISAKELKDGEHNEAWQEYDERCEESGETDEMKQWREENEKLRRQVEGLLHQYRESVDNQDADLIDLRPVGLFGTFRMYFGNPDVPEDISMEQRASTMEAGRQAARQFTEFMKKQYFEQEDKQQ